MVASCSASDYAISNASAQSDYPEAAAAGATIGAGIAYGALLFMWLAGAVILSLFVLLTRRKKTIETNH